MIKYEAFILMSEVRNQRSEDRNMPVSRCPPLEGAKGVDCSNEKQIFEE
jgi:hypothetical protein